MNRGILCTIYAKPKDKALSDNDIHKIYSSFYKNEPFVRLKEGNEVPKTKEVIYTNFCDIATKMTENRIIILSAIDNLIKGASGQAVQNMNVMCGFDEGMGLV
jgi:N-acetyl-gamma-glutamyl-phosphate reductase